MNDTPGAGWANLPQPNPPNPEELTQRTDSESSEASNPAESAAPSADAAAETNSSGAPPEEDGEDSNDRSSQESVSSGAEDDLDNPPAAGAPSDDAELALSVIPHENVSAHLSILYCVKLVRSQVYIFLDYFTVINYNNTLTN